MEVLVGPLLIVCFAIAMNARMLRSGRKLAEPPPGVRLLSRGGALRVGARSYGRAARSFAGLALVVLAPMVLDAWWPFALLPAVYYATLGRWDRAGAALLVGLVVISAAGVVFDATGQASEATTLACGLVLLAGVGLWVVAVIDNFRHSIRANLERGVAEAWQRVENASAASHRCPRCNKEVGSVRSGALCTACLADLAPMELSLEDPFVRVTSMELRTQDPSLAALRAETVALGSITGEVVAAPVALDRRSVRIIGKSFASWDSHSERAWRDPDDPARLWTHDRTVAVRHSGVRRELRSLMLHTFEAGRLTASWTMGTFDEAPQAAPLA